MSVALMTAPAPACGANIDREARHPLCGVSDDCPRHSLHGSLMQIRPRICISSGNKSPILGLSNEQPFPGAMPTGVGVLRLSATS